MFHAANTVRQCVATTIPDDQRSHNLLGSVGGDHLQAVAGLPVRPLSLPLLLPVHGDDAAGGVDHEGN